MSDSNVIYTRGRFHFLCMLNNYVTTSFINFFIEFPIAKKQLSK